MKKKIMLLSIVLILTIIEGISLYGLFKPSKETILENVKTIDLKKDKTIAIMVQDTEGDEWHEADNRESWPDPSTHGFVGAECTDSDGAEIDYTDILQFDLSNYTAEINTKSSIYCTLYFAKGEPALNKLQNTGGTTFASGNKTAVDGMYRYKGTASAVTNNYICFGTTDKEECLATPKTYMYRIIGITSTKDDTLGIPSNSLKIIKATPSSESQVWHDIYTSDVKWDSSAMKAYLNTTFYNSITSAQPNGAYWDSIILSHSWYNADYRSVPATEPTTSHTTASKIGLMYATDYKNSGDQNINNWLFIKNGWSTNSSLSGNALNEWTLSRFGLFGIYYRAWYVNSDYGNLNDASTLDNTYAVRPVFYLQSGVNLTGQGTASDPFIITTKNNA